MRHSSKSPVRKAIAILSAVVQQNDLICIVWQLPNPRAQKPGQGQALCATKRESYLRAETSSLLPYKHIQAVPFPPQASRKMCKTGTGRPPIQSKGNQLASKAAQQARYRRVRQHWQHAKKLSHTIRPEELEAWLGDVKQNIYGARERLIKLIHVRQSLYRNYNMIGVLRLDAAIWLEICKHKKIQHL